jgi:hypothetical protein
MVFGSDAVNGKKRQVVRADGQLEAFCKYCGYDEGLQFKPEVEACGKVVLLNDVEKEDTEDIGALPAPGLGRGWSDDKQMAAFIDCFEGTEKSHGGSKSVTSLESAGSYEEIRKSLAAHAKGKVSAKAFSGGIESKYARDIRDSQFTKSFYFAQTIELPTVRFQPSDYGVDALTAQGKKAYAKGPEEFRRVCGNRLITELHQGAALYATMQLHFASHQDKQAFEAQSKASFGGMAEIKTSIQTTIQTYRVKGNLKIMTYQVGGDSSQLPKVFGKCGQKYCITVCSFDNLDACDQIIAGVLSYAQNDFPGQIDYREGIVFGSAYPIAYTMPKLSDVVGIDVSDSMITGNITAARKFFKALYTNQTDILSTIKHAFEVPEDHHIPGDVALQNLKMAQRVLENNAALIESAALDCYSELSKCEKLERELVGKLTNVTIVQE